MINLLVPIVSFASIYDHPPTGEIYQPQIRAVIYDDSLVVIFQHNDFWKIGLKILFS